MSIMLKFMGYSVDDDVSRAVDHHESLLNLSCARNYEVTKVEHRKEHGCCTEFDKKMGKPTRVGSVSNQLDHTDVASYSVGRSNGHVAE